MVTKPVWTLTLRSPDGKPREFTLKSGKNTIGRGAENDIVISEISASRYHAEIVYQPELNEVTIRDLESLNGTFVNREMLSGICQLRHNDVIRIGLSVLHVTDPNFIVKTNPRDTGTRPLTRDFLLESLDHHAVLLYEVSRKMNTILDIDTALEEVSTMMQRTMGADKCTLILADQFDQLSELGFPTTIARLAIEQQAAVITPEVSTEQAQLGLSVALLRCPLCVMCSHFGWRRSFRVGLYV